MKEDEKNEERGKPLEGEVETLGVSGWIEVIVKDKDGKIKYRFPEVEGGGEDEGDCLFTSLPSKLPDFHWRKNIVTDAGLAAIIRLIFAQLTETKFGYIAIGTGTTAETASDTALVSELARKAASITQITTSISGDTAKLEAEFSSADGLSGTRSIAETGIFNASTGGIMLARKTFPTVTLNFDLGDSITIRYYVQMTRV
jgi:hypothetical protein